MTAQQEQQEHCRQQVHTLTALALPALCTVPWVGRFWAEEGSRMPPTVFISASSALTTTRSPTGVTVLICGAARRRG